MVELPKFPKAMSGSELAQQINESNLLKKQRYSLLIHWIQNYLHDKLIIDKEFVAKLEADYTHNLRKHIEIDVKQGINYKYPVQDLVKLLDGVLEALK